MNDQAFSIVPPPDLVEQWADDSVPHHANAMGKDWERAFAARAAQWGSDQELEECCKWMKNASFGLSVNTSAYQLRAARRPKLLSLKEQALQALCRFQDSGGHDDCDQEEIQEDYKIIRRAIENLSDD